jgi:hypothetical protein
LAKYYRDGVLQKGKITDLANMPLDDHGYLLTIKGIVKAQDYGIDVAKYYRDGVLQKGFA